mmetsp:Transcript_3633/g.9327  ORF Transcript_3633/g.9327 Transcript_3633/m.9327 type:complete len:106 (+) Transcript_3633:126-443(+)
MRTSNEVGKWPRSWQQRGQQIVVGLDGCDGVIGSLAGEDVAPTSDGFERAAKSAGGIDEIAAGDLDDGFGLVAATVVGQVAGLHGSDCGIRAPMQVQSRECRHRP